jgi:hypothetical protein
VWYRNSTSALASASTATVEADVFSQDGVSSASAVSATLNASASVSGNEGPAAQPPKSKNFSLVRLLLQRVAELHADGHISLDQKRILKDKIVYLDPTILAVATCFQSTKDEGDFLDSLQRICARHQSQRR